LSVVEINVMNSVPFYFILVETVRISRNSMQPGMVTSFRMESNFG